MSYHFSPIMTRYAFLHRIAEILVPHRAEEFFDFLLHSSDDDGGFLRTRYCYWDKTLPDSAINYQVNCALVTLQRKYDFTNLSDFYTSNGGTAIKLQVHFGEYKDEYEFYMESEWASSVGFSYPVKIDMEKGTYEISEFVYDKRRHYRIGQPKYSTTDSVLFHLVDRSGNHIFREGTIRVVDAFGTIEQQEEPSYDIAVIENDEVCLYKHIRESCIKGRHRDKKLKANIRDE